MPPKFCSEQAGVWLAHDYGKVYAVQTSAGPDRLCIGASSDGAALLRALSLQLSPPFYLLYVLVVPRGVNPAGRYQSRELDREQLDELFGQFGAFWDVDGRHAIWIYSVTDQVTLVYSRTNLIYVYGLVDRFGEELSALGYERVDSLTPPSPHQHAYQADFDPDQHACAGLPGVHFSALRERDGN